MKTWSRILLGLGIVLLPIVLFLNNVGGFLAKMQSEAAVAQTNADGVSWQMMRWLTQVQQHYTLLWAMCSLCFAGAFLLSILQMSKDENPEPPDDARPA